MKVFQIVFSYKIEGKESRLIEADNLKDAKRIAEELSPSLICPSVNKIKRSVYSTTLNPAIHNPTFELKVIRKEEFND